MFDRALFKCSLKALHVKNSFCIKLDNKYYCIYLNYRSGVNMCFSWHWFFCYLVLCFSISIYCIVYIYIYIYIYVSVDIYVWIYSLSTLENTDENRIVFVRSLHHKHFSKAQHLVLWPPWWHQLFEPHWWVLGRTHI